MNMKFLSSIIVAVLICLTACNKSSIFNGSRKISGIVLFNNILNGNKLDTAKFAKIEITNTDSKETYSLTTKDGIFELNYLNNKNTTLLFKSTYSHIVSNLPLTYTVETTINTTDNESKPIQLELNNIDNATHLKFKITDSLNNALDSAKIFVYSNYSYMLANGNTGAGAIYTGITGKNGIFIIPFVEAKNYSFRANAKIGVISLSNISTQSIDSTKTLISNKVNEVHVKLYQN